MRVKLHRVHYMPKVLKPGVLYVSEEFGEAAHLCACGCGAKIRTPLGPTEWALEETNRGPTLHPSIGNWQQSCKSHYWIDQGDVIWSDEWTPAQIVSGRHGEEARRRDYYNALDRHRGGILRKCWHRVKNLFGAHSRKP